MVIIRYVKIVENHARKIIRFICKNKKMNIGICTIVYNEYGKFLAQRLKSIEGLNTKPTEVVVVLGKNYGDQYAPVVWPNNVKVVKSDSDNMGVLKNLAVENLSTEWVVNIGVDDEILPWAIEEFSKHVQNKDVIAAKYLFLPPNKSVCMHPRINTEVLLSKEYYTNGSNYMHGGSPFKRELWLRNPYKENECFNSLFWIDVAAEGANFGTTDIPCLIYNNRKGSHSDIELKERAKRFKIINEYRESKLE
jgi:hypothetical protein